MGYCDPKDLYSFGLSRGAVQNPARRLSTVDPAADTLELNVHGLDLDDAISFRAEANGALPTPLVAGTTYYAIPVNEYTFQVSATVGGSAIDLTDAGSRILVIVPMDIAGAISFGAEVINDHLPAHAVPLTAPYPEIIKITNAELAVSKLASVHGFKAASLSETIDMAQKRIARWAKGIPLRGNNVPPPTNLARAATVPYTDARGWNKHGGL